MIKITPAPFGATKTGEPVTCWTMENGRGMTVKVLDYGCTIQSLEVPDRDGAPVDVVLGYDGIGGYEAGTCWFGAFVGRYANRIKNASFTLNGTTYALPQNDGPNHLHGTFERRIFAGAAEDGKLVLRYVSPAGEEGYPGTLAVTVNYELTEDSALRLAYRAVTDADTVVNLTNHSYFNLSGHDSGTVLDQTLRLAASRFTEGDERTTPTGRVLPVAGTALDFRAEKAIGRDLDDGDPVLSLCGGFDHNLILDKGPGFGYGGTAYSHATGIEMTFATTQPAVQLYSGNFVTDTPRGKGGAAYPRRGGFCLESQHYPCSPNFPAFPTTVLRPGEEYCQLTEYKFGVRE